MNDDSLTPEAELASAALDNEVTEDERALVTESPSLRDELAFYANLRSRLADVPVPAEARESAVAAALAAFDEIKATGSDVEPELAAAVAATKVAAIAPVVSLHERRQRQYRWIGGAAAAAVVAVLAIGVLGNLGGESRDESSAPALKVSDESEQTEAAAARPEIAIAQAGESADSVAPDAAPSAAATEAANDSANDELGGISGPADVSAWYAAPQLDTDDDVIAFVTSDPFAMSSTPPVNTRAGDAASETTAAGAAETSAAPAPATTVVSAATTASNDTEAASTGSGTDSSTECPQLSIGPFARAVYQGRQVYVVVDDAHREILVVDRIGCDVDRRVRLP